MQPSEQGKGGKTVGEGHGCIAELRASEVPGAEILLRKWRPRTEEPTAKANGTLCCLWEDLSLGCAQVRRLETVARAAAVERALLQDVHCTSVFSAAAS